MIVIGPGPATEEQLRFYAALGWAVSQWASVEFWLKYIYSRVTRGGGEAQASFDAVFNFNAHINMINAAVQMRFRDSEDVLGRWTSLRNRCKKRAGARNELAHFTVVQTTPPLADGSSIFLQPDDWLSILKHDGEPPKLVTKQIMERGTSFAKLANELEKFFNSLPS